MARQNEKEPNVWVTALKLVLGAAVIIGGVGFALWMAAQGSGYSPALQQALEEVKAKSPKGTSTDSSWGISKDSPVRK
ncbi:MAG: hypothetical protein V4627_18835 [Pseudomonadota bacterium]